MRKIGHIQGSADWLNWRRKLLTATDAAVILGKSPYCTPYQLWQRKLGEIPEQESNSAMERGKTDEPIARAMFTEFTGLEMEPCCVESSEYNFLGASLDGISSCGKYLLEIKSNGSHYHSFLETKGIPDFHIMQMQHQLLVTGAEKCFYCSYNNGGIVIMEVFRDEIWMDKYLPKAKEFWKGIVLFEAPALCDKDYKDMTGSAMWRHYAQEYNKVSEEIKALEVKKENFKRELIALCNEQSCSGAGLKVLKKIMKGRIDYNSIPEIENLDLEKYRKPSLSSWTVMICS